MKSQALTLLKTIFGYDHFRGHQEAVIDALILGQDVLVLMPTGGGKSLCYQIPSLIRDGTGIVVSPLIALMQDQVSALKQLGIRAAFLNSSLNAEQLLAVEETLLAGELDLLYIAPERLNTRESLKLFSKINIALFAIDEAHCVSQWGHDFRADYLKLSILHDYFPNVPRIALTATADERTREEIRFRLHLENAPMFISGFDRPNIHYAITQKNHNEKRQLLDFIVSKHANDTGIVYCLSRNRTEEVALWLQECGIDARPYHAGLPNKVRQFNQQWFLMNENVVMVATIAFGMGIDKPNVRFVAHLDLPKTIEGYYQETGRAGRDGLPANAWMAYGLNDVVMLRRFITHSDADVEHKNLEHHKLNAMLALCEQFHCRRQTLLRYFGENLELPCGNCDNCLKPVKTSDATFFAQQALSCVFRCGQSFGANHLIDVLLGIQNEKVLAFRHHKVSTFGIGKQLTKSQWEAVFRQLVARGFIEVDFGHYFTMRLSEKCRPLLRGEEMFILREDFAPQIDKRRLKKTLKERKTKAKIVQYDIKTALWNALREKRRELSEAQQVAPYSIFQDMTLMEMLEKRPKNLEEIGALSGVGEYKLAHYAQDFLNILKCYEIIENPTFPSAQKTMLLFQINQDVSEIAKLCQLQESTICGHLMAAIAEKTVTVGVVTKLPEKEIKDIRAAIEQLTDDENFSLKPVYELFEGKYHYGILKCVHASL